MNFVGDESVKEEEDRKRGFDEDDHFVVVENH